MRSNLIAFAAFALLAAVIVAWDLAPNMASGAAPAPLAFGGASGIPVELTPLW
jgi:hypothetical protein